MKTYRWISMVFLSGGLLCFGSCSDWIEVAAPKTDLVKENVFKDNVTALAAVSAIYAQISGLDSFANGSLTLNFGAYADDLVSYSNTNAFYLNTVAPVNQDLNTLWTDCYSEIYKANLIIEGLDNSTNVTAAIKNQLKGEALFLRAFCHFYLVNVFGDVPLIISSDYRTNSITSRTPSGDVYKQIIDDLILAKSLLTNTYPSTGRVRANSGAATALLSRAYLFSKDYVNAEIQATEVINNSATYKLETDLNSVFKTSSNEVIWHLIPSGGIYKYTNEAFRLILMAAPTGVALDERLFSSFEPNDNRRTSWIRTLIVGASSYRYAFKYKENQTNATGAEYSVVLRLAEQYLIRAEARAQLGKLIGANTASSDINVIRSRAGLPATNAVTKDDILMTILKERRAELFTEWGHRFFDLRRTAHLDEVMSTVKTNWASTNALLPLPQSEILNNPNLKPQNPGY